jgi:hypothetical protein
VTRALCVDERLILRACSLTLALASGEGKLVAVAERKRVKMREVEVLGADVARIFAVARATDMSGCRVGTGEGRCGVFKVPRARNEKVRSSYY